MAICIRLNVGKLQITSRHKEHQTKHNRHCFNRIRYHVSNYHSNCEILDPRLLAPNRAAGGYSHSERQALTALSRKSAVSVATRLHPLLNDCVLFALVKLAFVALLSGNILGFGSSVAFTSRAVNTIMQKGCGHLLASMTAKH